MCDPSVYRVCKDRSEVGGREVCELFTAGSNYIITRSNPGALFIRKEGLLPYMELIRPFAGWVAGKAKRVCGGQLWGLQLALDLVWRGLTVARTAEDLKRITPYVQVSAQTFALVRPEVMRTTASLADTVQAARNRRECLWVLGVDSGKSVRLPAVSALVRGAT